MDKSLKTSLVLGVLLCLPATPVASQNQAGPRARLKALRAEGLSAVAQAAAPSMPARTVVVDCAKGGRISAALATNQGPLLIRLRGICRENVRIERSDVTIRGQDPTTDGVQGVAASPQPAALEFYHANRIALENISVSDGPGRGIGAWYSDLTMTNCRVERNGSTGLHISASSYLLGTELVVSWNSANWWGGILSQRGSLAQCGDCRLEGNAGFAATARLGGYLSVGGQISGAKGISAELGGGSYVEAACGPDTSGFPCGIEATGIAASATDGGTANLYDLEFSGRLQAWSGGRVGVFGGRQTLLSGSNDFGDSSWLSTGAYWEGTGRSASLAKTNLHHFSRANLFDQTELQETLGCDSGADAWSDTPCPPAKVIGCQHVPSSAFR